MAMDCPAKSVPEGMRDWCGKRPGKIALDKPLDNHKVPHLNEHDLASLQTIP